MWKVYLQDCFWKAGKGKRGCDLGASSSNLCHLPAGIPWFWILFFAFGTGPDNHQQGDLTILFQIPFFHSPGNHCEIRSDCCATTYCTDIIRVLQVFPALGVVLQNISRIMHSRPPDLFLNGSCTKVFRSMARFQVNCANKKQKKKKKLFPELCMYHSTTQPTTTKKNQVKYEQ